MNGKTTMGKSEFHNYVEDTIPQWNDTAYGSSIKNRKEVEMFGRIMYRNAIITLL